MSIERARAHLKQFGADARILEFPVSSATVELAAEAAGVIPARIAKTLSFMIGEKPILIVMAGDARLDNSRFKAQFHTKAKMPQPDVVEAVIGHAVGGVCPFGINDGIDVYLDESLRRFDTVYPACGSSNSAIELSCDELEKFSGGTWIDVCKSWREEEITVS
ncbi:MAG: YbaK/EbsC family protein [Clostridia bacterium]|nr:YbaK/EbsC family protein [Clostridia bacterium]